MRIAVYGKGGIGKSTIASNLSVGLASGEKRVLHIGCDPKGDSCQGIMGRTIPDFVQMLAEKGADLQAEDIIFKGKRGVHCMEVGGPRNGNGCAGMGMNAMNSMMERFGIWEKHWDYIVYDVLGDIVCSGFSTPMREKYADLTYIVTSAEYMSLYAANNILCALAAAGEGEKNFGGFIFNRYQEPWEEAVFEEFIRRTGGKEAGRIPLSREIRRADYAQQPFLMSESGAGAPREAFERRIKVVKEGKGIAAHPMSREEMADFRKYCMEKEEENDAASEVGN